MKSTIRVSEINIYPIKSMKGITLHTAYVERRGIQFDRRWMLVDEAGRFISQREVSRLALLSTLLNNDTLTVNAPGKQALHLPMTLAGSERISAQLWDDTILVLPAGKERDRWFSEFLGVGCRLVYMPDDTIRPVASEFALASDIVSLADGFPLLLISESSLDDLNARLADPVPMNRFRPSIVVTGCAAFEEDKWKRIQIGNLVLRVVKPCSRCVTTTVDQATGVQGKEPLATLSQYRKVNGKVYFGQNAIPENNAVVNIGDRLTVIS
jgi:uncharacterized protein YcbX